MPKIPERRKNDRLPFSSMLQVRLIDDALRASADAVDLSISGMAFRTRLPLTVGDEVRIHVGDVAEHIVARVRHVAGDVIGVEHAPRA